MDKREILESLSIEPVNPGAYARGWMAPAGGEKLDSINPTDGTVIASVIQADAATYEKVSAIAHEAFLSWRMVPAPKRGEVIRSLGDELRANKEALGHLVSLEMGKILAEGLGEVQEMIDMCDFSVGLSRQLYGLAMHSERPRHRMYEQWHPLGTVGVVTAFNFPVAVWSWNTALAAVCGDPVIWKPSSNTPLTAVAVQHIANRVAARFDCDGIFNLAIGKGSVVGQRLVDDPRVPLISFTGSTSQGRKVSASVGTHLRRLQRPAGEAGARLPALQRAPDGARRGHGYRRARAPDGGRRPRDRDVVPADPAGGGQRGQPEGRAPGARASGLSR